MVASRGCSLGIMEGGVIDQFIWSVYKVSRTKIGNRAETIGTPH